MTISSDPPKLLNPPALALHSVLPSKDQLCSILRNQLHIITNSPLQMKLFYRLAHGDDLSRAYIKPSREPGFFKRLFEPGIAKRYHLEERRLEAVREHFIRQHAPAANAPFLFTYPSIRIKPTRSAIDTNAVQAQPVPPPVNRSSDFDSKPVLQWCTRFLPALLNQCSSTTELRYDGSAILPYHRVPAGNGPCSARQAELHALQAHDLESMMGADRPVTLGQLDSYMNTVTQTRAKLWPLVNGATPRQLGALFENAVLRPQAPMAQHLATLTRHIPQAQQLYQSLREAQHVIGDQGMAVLFRSAYLARRNAAPEAWVAATLDECFQRTPATKLYDMFEGGQIERDIAMPQHLADLTACAERPQVTYQGLRERAFILGDRTMADLLDDAYARFREVGKLV